MIANEVDTLPKVEQSEHDIQNKIIKKCRDRGALVWRINSGGNISKRGGRIALQKKGTADTFILYRGIFITAEIKKLGEKATDEQIAFLEDIAKHGGVGLLAYDVEFVNTCLNWLDFIHGRLPDKPPENAQIMGNRLFVGGIQ